MNLENGTLASTVLALKSETIDLDTYVQASPFALNAPFLTIAATSSVTVDWEDLTFTNLYDNTDIGLMLQFYNPTVYDTILNFAAAEVFRIKAGEIKVLNVHLDGASNPTFSALDSVDLSEVTTACASGSLFYANGSGGIACTDPDINFSAGTLTGTANINLAGAEMSFTKNDTSDTAELVYASGGDANKLTIAATQAEITAISATAQAGVSTILNDKTYAYYIDATTGAEVKIDTNGVKLTRTDLATSDTREIYVSATVIQSKALDAVSGENSSIEISDTTTTIVTSDGGTATGTNRTASNQVELMLRNGVDELSGVIYKDDRSIESYCASETDYYVPSGGFVVSSNGNTKKLRIRAEAAPSGTGTTNVATFTMPDVIACSARIRGVLMLQESGAAKVWNSSVEKSVRRTGAATFVVSSPGGQSAAGNYSPNPTVSCTTSGATVSVGIAHNLPAGTYKLYCDLEVYILVP